MFIEYFSDICLISVRSSMRSRQSPSLSGGSGANIVGNIQRSSRVQLSQAPEYDIENGIYNC
jgi:hypothetical protein